MATAALVATFGGALTAAQALILEDMNADMRFLLDEFEVESQVQLVLIDRGYKNLSTFSVLADDLASARVAFVADFVNPGEAGLSALAVSAARLALSKLLAAWKVAQQRTADDVRVTADARALRLPTILPRTALVALRIRFEAENGRVTDAIWPSACLIEKRFEEVEQGTCSATPLVEVISEDLCEEDTIIIHEAGTNVKVRKAAKAIAMPVTTEQFRNRMMTLAITYVLANYKHASRLWLRTATMQNWLRYVNYILSDEVALYSLDREGLSVQASWETVLSYEFAMRKRMCRSILFDKLDFGAAMEAAILDLHTKERYFISPTALLAGARSSSSSSAAHQVVTGLPYGVPVPPAPTLSNRKRKAEAKARAKANSAHEAKVVQAKPEPKGKAKGKGKKNRQTPDGRLICDFYNKAAGCTRENCSFVHICSICFGNHPSMNCKAAGA